MSGQTKVFSTCKAAAMRSVLAFRPKNNLKSTMRLDSVLFCRTLVSMTILEK